MKELFKNWKLLGIGGAIGATLVGAVMGTIKVVKHIKENKYIAQIESYEVLPSDGETQSEE